MSDATESPREAEAQPSNPHAETVRTLASAMLRSAVWPGVATVVIATIIAAFLVGVPGFAGSLVGGIVAFASCLATVGLMRWSADFHPMFTMAVALGGYVGKLIVLLIVMTLLGGIEGLHPMSLAGTLLATVVVWTAAEVNGFRKTKVPTIVPGS